MATLQVTGHGTRKLKPLSTSLSFRFEGGAPVQAVNSVTGEHVPDWRFSPIRIVPVITVTDPEGLIANGVHNSDTPTANMRWMCDDTGVNVLAGESPADISMDTSASDLRGALNIRRNFAAGTLLRFEYEFATSAGGVLRTVKHSATVPIKVNQMADALVQVRTAYPRGQYVFFPSPISPHDLAMDMRLYHKGKPCPAAYRWYAVNKDGQETLIPGQNGAVLTRPANTVQSVDHYRCKALDMRPEYAPALETAIPQARADIYRKYLGDEWEAVLPTCSDNILAPNFYFSVGGGKNRFISDLGQDPGRPVGYHSYRYYGEVDAVYSFYNFYPGKLPLLSGRTVTFSFSARNRLGGVAEMHARLYIKKTDSWAGIVVCDGPTHKVSSEFVRVSARFDVPNLSFDGDTALLLAPMFEKLGQVDVEIKDISCQLDGGEHFLPAHESLESEIRDRAAEIAAANPPVPPAVWPLARTYTRDFSLKVHMVPYELILRVEGLGEEVIVRNGSLARGSGAAQQLFSNVPRSMTRLRSSVICRQGRHTYSAEETARMFDVQWPASAINISGCTATMTDLSFAISINTKY